MTQENDTLELCYGDNQVLVELIEEERECSKYDWCASFEKESSCENHCHVVTGKILITINNVL